MILLVPTISCKNIFGPSDPPVDPYNIYEIMYVRVLPIINPYQPDPTNGLFEIFNPTTGGFNSAAMIQIESNKWVAEVLLKDGGPYFIALNDLKVVKIVYGVPVPSTAEDIYMRLKGTDSWVGLASVELRTDERGKWSRFFASKGIKNP
jgi:hypothetical protein